MSTEQQPPVLRAMDPEAQKNYLRAAAEDLIDPAGQGRQLFTSSAEAVVKTIMYYMSLHSINAGIETTRALCNATLDVLTESQALEVKEATKQ